MEEDDAEAIYNLRETIKERLSSSDLKTYDSLIEDSSIGESELVTSLLRLFEKDDYLRQRFIEATQELKEEQEDENGETQDDEVPDIQQVSLRDPTKIEAVLEIGVKVDEKAKEDHPVHGESKIEANDLEIGVKVDEKAKEEPPVHGESSKIEADDLEIRVKVDSCSLVSKATRSCDMSNVPSKSGTSSILGDLLSKYGNDSGKFVTRESSGLNFSKRLCLVVDDLINEGPRTSDTNEVSSSDKNRSCDSPVDDDSDCNPFKEMVVCAGQIDAITDERESEKGIFLHSDGSIERSEQETPSYKLIPEEERSQVLDTVLNNKFVSHVKVDTEEPGKLAQEVVQMKSDTPEQKKLTICKNAMARCEDDMYETYMAIAFVTSAVERAQEVINGEMRMEEVGEKFYSCIEQLYGKAMVNNVKQNHQVALPRILTRLQKKLEQLTRNRENKKSRWKDILERNSAKAKAISAQISARGHKEN